MTQIIFPWPRDDLSAVCLQTIDKYRARIHHFYVPRFSFFSPFLFRTLLVIPLMRCRLFAADSYSHLLIISLPHAFIYFIFKLPVTVKTHAGD